MTFRENLQTIRKFNHLSQEKLATKIGVSRQAVSKWENGEAYPATANIIAICSVLHCKITDLVDTSSEESKNFTAETRQEIIALTDKDYKHLRKISKIIYVLAKTIRYFTLLIFVVIGITLYASIYPFINYIFSGLSEGVAIEKLGLIDFFQLGIISKAMSGIFVTVIYVLTALFLYLTMRETEHFFNRISNQNSPFSLENTLSLKKISQYLALCILSSTISDFLFMIIDPTHKPSINLPAIFFVLIAICFIYIFRYGHILESSKNNRKP